MIDFATIRKLAQQLPGIEEGTSYGTPALRVGKRLILRLHDKEDAIVLLLDSVEEQQELISQDPLCFFITDHYKGYAAVLVRPTIATAEFQALLERSWRRVARKRDLAEFEQRNTKG